MNDFAPHSGFKPKVSKAQLYEAMLLQLQAGKFVPLWRWCCGGFGATDLPRETVKEVMLQLVDDGYARIMHGYPDGFAIEAVAQ